MSHHRFFLNEELPEGLGPVVLPMSHEDLHHAVQVLRVRPGETLEVVEPNAKRAWRVRAVRATAEGILAERLAPMEPAERLSRPHVVLVQGVAKGDKMDAIVRQAVELGAEEIVPVLTSRSIVRMDARKRAEKGERWRRVAKAASEQSHRDEIPAVPDPVRLNDVLPRLSGFDGVIVLWEEERDRQLGTVIKQWAERPDARVALIVGPEGGLTAEEVEQLAAIGGLSVSLGTGVLRTETAAVAALSIALFSLGGLGGERA